HSRGFGEFVVHIHHQDEVERILGELRIGRASKNQFHVAQLPVIDVLFHEPDHPILDVFTNDLPGGTDNVGKPPNVISDTAAYIRDDRSFLDVECGEHAV